MERDKGARRYRDIKEVMAQRRINRAILKYKSIGWEIVLSDPQKRSAGRNYTITSPEGSPYYWEGVFANDTSELDYDEREPDRQKEYRQANQLFKLINWSWKYNGTRWSKYFK